MITRKEACNVLEYLIDSPILDNDLLSDLADIVYCINAETVGLHVWGASENIVEIVRQSIDAKDFTALEKYVYGMSDWEEENERANNSESAEQGMQDVSGNKTDKK